MSNPIAENAFYFARQKSSRHGSQEHARPHLARPSAESSSSSRLGPNRDSGLFFDNSTRRSQWTSVFSRLSFLGEAEREEESDIEDSSRDSFQLLHAHRAKQQQQEEEQPTTEEDNLPAPHDLDHDEELDDTENFFVHPFRDIPSERTLQTRIRITEPPPPPPLAAAAPPPVEQGDSSSSSARSHWDKTLDRIKVITNLQTLQERDVPSMSLAPYCPPVFEPAFIALSTDEYGRKLVKNFI